MEKFLGMEVQLDDKKYALVAANNGNAGCLSLRNVESGLFLRHKNGKLLDTDANDNPKFFPADSSFVSVESGEGFLLHCSNAGMEDKYICKIDLNTFIINGDLVEYVFRPVKMMSSPMSAASVPQMQTDAYGSSFLGLGVKINGVEFLTVPANDGQEGHVSLLNALTGQYARHFKGMIMESGREVNAEFFPQDSSFLPESRDDGFVLRCVNKGMENVGIASGKSGNDPMRVDGMNKAHVFPAVRDSLPWNAVKAFLENSARLVTLLGDLSQKNAQM